MRILQFRINGQKLSKDGDFSGLTSDDIILMMADIIGGQE